MSIAASGEFWLPETPGKAVRGVFKADPGKQPEATLARALVEDPLALPGGGSTAGADGGSSIATTECAIRRSMMMMRSARRCWAAL
jgi:hypothetical protein